MSVVEPGSAGAGLFARVRNLLLRPTDTWAEIDAEAATVGGLFRGYVLPLAAIPAVASAIGMIAFGLGGFGVSFRPSPVWVLVQTLVGYALSIGMVFVLSLIIDALAPTFGGTKDRIQATKVAAYAPTASWVAGVVMLFPLLGILALAGAIYSLVLLHKGLAPLMKAPAERGLPYTVVVALCAIVASLLIGSVTGIMTSRFGMGPDGLSGVSGKVEIPGQGSVDIGELQSAAEKAAAAAKAVQSGDGPPATSPEALQAMLPISVGGFTRERVSTGSGGVGGFEGSQAEGEYVRGETRLRLSVTDVGAAGALAGLAGAFDARRTEETATGYEKVGVVDGRLTTEEYDRSARRGEYGVMVGERFMVQAEGEGVSMEELKAAVGAVDARRLETMAKAGR